MKRKVHFLLVLLLVFLLAIPAAAQENEELVYFDVQVDVYQSATQNDLTSSEKLVDGIPVAEWLYQTVCAGIEAGEEIIDIYKAGLSYIPEEWSNRTGESYELLSSTFKRVENSNPRWIFLANGYSVEAKGNVFSKFVVKYRPDYEDLMPAFEAAIDEAVAAVSDRPTDLEKIIAAHDYLVDNCAYNWTIGTWNAYDNAYNPELYPDNGDLIFSAYGALVNSDAVCQGYAMAFKLLLDEMGIDSVITSSEAMNHAWNFVELNGEWYHVDVTWDDATPDRPGGGRYDYFMLSDDTMRERNHYDWETSYTCDDTTYEAGYAFNNAKTLMHYWNGEYYFTDNSTLYKGDLTGEWTELADLSGYYYSALWKEDQLFYVNGYYGGRQFLQLMRCDLTTGEIAEVGEEYDFVQTAAYRYYGEEQTPVLIYKASDDLAGLRLSENGANVEIVSTTRREVLVRIPFVDHPIEWDEAELNSDEQARIMEPVYDKADETLELGLLLKENHEVRNLMVAFYHGHKLAGVRLLPVRALDSGLLIIDEVSIADLPAWDQMKVIAMSGSTNESAGFSLCTGIVPVNKP